MAILLTAASHPAMNDEMAATVSSHFRPGEPNMQDADMVLLAAGGVPFYAHRAKLLLRSSNSFGGLVAPGHSSVEITMPSFRPEVLNVVLLAVYDFSMQSSDHSLKTLCEVIPALTTLGYDLCSIAAPHSRLFQLLLRAAESDPLSLYAVAAQHSFEELAVLASTFSLSSSIKKLSDELAQQMGAIYLRRLLHLHSQRSSSLRRLISPPPTLHPPTDDYPKCNEEIQQSIDRRWLVVSAHAIFRDSSIGVEDMITIFLGRVECPGCVESLNVRLAGFLGDWNMVQSSI